MEPTRGESADAATLFLQQQRQAFTDQVARQDHQRARTAEEVNMALQELEAERRQMDETHRQLESETAEAKRLEALCAELEAQLDIAPKGKSDSSEELAELEAAVAQEKSLLQHTEDRLASAAVERSSLRSAVAAAEARAPLREKPAKALANEMRSALEEMAAESLRQAEAFQARVEQRLEDASFRTKAVAEKVNRVKAHRMWDREVAALLDALQEAEGITSQQLQLLECSPHGPAGEAAREVAALRHSVASELRASFTQAFR
ncbi:unnamed protein product [Symbiodinium natans]|uniref:Uncharacterized protein n=1 Tax=Symbiodinium natans TaxID=878477 RepID=A0A812KTC9_9DINO|nr:unnamed protein product [Symbiodinium natans]